MEISGHFDRKFARLSDAFRENFELRGEVGAAIALRIDGEDVLSLWGGSQDLSQNLPWRENTLTNVYSTTKGVAASVIAILASDGLLNYEDKVAKHWPEFAVSGKESVTVAMLLSHQSGLAGFRKPVSLAELYDHKHSAETLAAMEPLWTPGTAHGYHPITIGFLVDEVCRRVTGKGIRDLVRELLTPLCDDGVYIGCPEKERYRAATLYAPKNLSSANVVDQILDEVQQIALTNPLLDPEVPNTAEWRSAVIASANGFASAKGLATLYGELATIGVGSLSRIPISQSTLDECLKPQADGIDKTLAVPTQWGCGFLINSLGIYGPTPTSFGHSGWGGSFAYADPVKRLGFAYTMNQMGTDLINDPRNLALLESLYACLD
ncbi:MAG: serine hydrolase domain-containing protein [Pseudomonadota bacterium]